MFLFWCQVQGLPSQHSPFHHPFRSHIPGLFAATTRSLCRLSNPNTQSRTNARTASLGPASWWILPFAFFVYMNRQFIYPLEQLVLCRPLLTATTNFLAFSFSVFWHSVSFRILGFPIISLSDICDRVSSSVSQSLTWRISDGRPNDGHDGGILFSTFSTSLPNSSRG